MKKKIVCVIGVILIITGCLLLLLFFKESFFNKNVREPVTVEVIKAETQKTTEKPYESPINFKKLKKQYPNVIAWIDIPGTEISYPVFQSTYNDMFYVDHDRNGDRSSYGEIFTEYKYNKNDFSDPVTVIYGHNMKDDTMFGSLQALYVDEETVSANKEIVIYLENCEYHYEVFASTTFDNRHILYNYDFEDKSVSDAFFGVIKNTRSLDTYFDEETYEACSGNKIILSTCKNGNSNKRFLVMAGQKSPYNIK